MPTTALRTLRTAGTALLLGALAQSAMAQQAYPSKPLRFVVPYAAGSTLDVLGRIIGPRLTEDWGQPVIIDARPGGNTVIGINAVLQAPADGYTLLLNSSGHALIPQLMSPPPYDPVKDFAAVATTSSSEFILLLSNAVKAGTLRELVALLKSQQGRFNYASTGVGSGPHVAGELFNVMNGVKAEHIAYKGGVPALTDLMGGQVQMFIYTTTGSVPYVKAGKVKALAVSGESRVAALPDVPTFTEAGLPGYDVKTWQGVLAPAATPRAAVDKLSQEIGRVLGLPDVKEKLLGLGTDPFVSTPAQFTELIRSDMAKFARVIKAANMKLE